MVGAIQRFEFWLGSKAVNFVPEAGWRLLAKRLCDQDPQLIIEELAPRLNRGPDIDNMPFDLPVNGKPQFEHLAGLFASTPLDHAVITMSVRQAAYLFGLIRDMKARKVIEIGRYKGGSTLLMAAAMNGQGELWSIDIGEKEDRLHNGRSSRPFDQQLADICKRFGLSVNIIVGDSRTVEIDSGEVDLVFIDGDHSYEGVKNDFRRFGKKVRLGGAVLFDDTFNDRMFKTHSDTVGRLVSEVIAEGEFKQVKAVNQMAHLERVRQANGY